VTETPWQGEGVTRIELDAGWTITGHLNGGYLTAVCADVACRSLDGKPPLTISTHYLHPVSGDGPADVDVEVVREGRLSTARVTLSRDGLVLVDALVTAGTPRSSGAAHERAVAPELPAYADCVDSSAAGPVAGMQLLHTLELRTDPRTAAAVMGGEPLDELVTQAWCGYRDGRPVDQLLVSAAWDVLPPTLWAGHIWGGTPTVSSQVLLFPGAVVGPLVLEARCETLRDGVVDETARAWDSSGRLVATARQTALFIAPREPGDRPRT